MKTKSGMQISSVCMVLSMCTACVTPTMLANRAVGFNEAAANASDTQLLLNIVRASYRNPTHYTAVTQLRETRVNEGNVGVAPSIPFGSAAPFVYSVAPTGSIRANEQPSFDVVPLDTKASAQGLLRPVDPQTFINYWRQGWPRSVLLFLFVDDVVINEAAKIACGLTDVPGNRIDNNAFNYESFKLTYRLFTCMHGAIRLEEQPKEKVFLNAAPIEPGEILKKLPELNKDDFDVVEGGTDANRRYTISKTQKRWAFTLSFNGRSGYAEVTPHRPSRLSSKKGPAISFSMRSVDGMVYYLGELVRAQRRGDPPPLVRVGPEHHESVLFRVEIGGLTAGRDSIEVDFLGERYAIPRVATDEDRTLTVLSLLSQLFSLYRESPDLPRTTAVQVVGSP